MTSCTIIISHYKSEKFLRACVRQIKKYAHPEIRQEILIVDQSTHEDFDRIGDLCTDGVTAIHVSPYYSGYGIDCAMRYANIQTDYICQVHVDAFPISNNWLYLPIKLIEENNLSFVGQLQFVSKPTDTIYPPNPFFAMAQCFNVARTETYREMSFEAGFTRYHQRATLDMEFKKDDWAQWAKEDYSARGSDDDIVAFHWQDKYKSENKLGLAITGYVEPSYGRIIEDIVLHFGSCREAINVMGQMPEGYRHYTERINTGYSDELIQEIIDKAKSNRPPGLEILSRNFWDGTTKQSFPPTDELNNRIEELKKVTN